MLRTMTTPHSDDSMRPNSRRHATGVFLDLPDDVVRKMVETNARRLDDFPRN